jgi:hypothetical protein
MSVSSIFSGASAVIGWAMRAAMPASHAVDLSTTCYPFQTNLEKVTSSVTGEMRARYDALLEKLPFRKKPELRGAHCQQIAAAVGCSLFPFSQQIILIDRNSEEIDPDAMWMFTKHEISHLHNNDTLRKKTVQLVSNIALAYFFPSFPLSAAMVYFGQFGLTTLIEKTMGKNAEASADVFACQDASENELQAFLRGLEALRRMEIARLQMLNKSPTSLATFKERGERVTVDPHPWVETRIQQVEQILKRLNPEIDF